MVEREEAAIKFFVTHQQFAKSVEPAVGHLNDPASGLLFRIAFELSCFLSSAFEIEKGFVTPDRSMHPQNFPCTQGGCDLDCISRSTLVKFSIKNTHKLIFSWSSERKNAQKTHRV